MSETGSYCGLVKNDGRSKGTTMATFFFYLYRGTYPAMARVQFSTMTHLWVAMGDARQASALAKTASLAQEPTGPTGSEEM